MTEWALANPSAFTFLAFFAILGATIVLAEFASSINRHPKPSKKDE